MLRPRIGKRKRKDGYTKMMKTLLLQNQQIIIQQQNMMFMVIKQFQQNPQSAASISSGAPTSSSSQHLIHNQSQQQQPQQQSSQSQPTAHHQSSQQSQSQQQQHHQSASSQPHLSQSQPHITNTSNSNHHHHQSQQQQQQQHHQHMIEEQSQPIYSQQQITASITTMQSDTQQMMQQVATQLHEHQHENLSSYLTPAASEQDPISDDKQDEDELAALLSGDGLLHNNLLYNPQTDIGSVTPYKSQQQQHQTPSYYSSGCESLTTPRVEHQRQPQTTNISQNVVKNLADSFKSPTKPKINVQILSSSARGNIKNSKAKIIQRMNISEFLRHVHPEKES